MFKFRKENGNTIATVEVTIKPNSEVDFQPAEIDINQLTTGIYDVVIAYTKQQEDVIAKILRAPDVIVKGDFIFANSLHRGFCPGAYEDLTACINLIVDKIFTRNILDLDLLVQILLQEFTTRQLAQMLTAIAANPQGDMTAFNLIFDILGEKQQRQYMDK